MTLLVCSFYISPVEIVLTILVGKYLVISKPHWCWLLTGLPLLAQ
jgi:hypothetical protein